MTWRQSAARHGTQYQWMQRQLWQYSSAGFMRGGAPSADGRATDRRAASPAPARGRAASRRYNRLVGAPPSAARARAALDSGASNGDGGPRSSESAWALGSSLDRPSVGLMDKKRLELGPCDIANARQNGRPGHLARFIARHHLPADAHAAREFRPAEAEGFPELSDPPRSVLECHAPEDTDSLGPCQVWLTRVGYRGRQTVRPTVERRGGLRCHHSPRC
jgi:hypothetical protein